MSQTKVSELNLDQKAKDINRLQNLTQESMSPSKASDMQFQQKLAEETLANVVDATHNEYAQKMGEYYKFKFCKLQMKYDELIDLMQTDKIDREQQLQGVIK